MLSTPHPRNTPGFFYLFLGSHSFLIGFLPFFLPAYLWQHGLELAGIALLIGVSGLSFVAALGIWQQLASRLALNTLVSLTFILELLLVLIVGLLTTIPGAALFIQGTESLPLTAPGIWLSAISIGIANGLYNAFFWTTQRTLFLQQLGSNDTGRQYGNFQIFVAVILKVGILLGGALLETGGFIWLLAISAGIGLSSCHYYLQHPQGKAPLITRPPARHRAHRSTYAGVRLHTPPQASVRTRLQQGAHAAKQRHTAAPPTLRNSLTYQDKQGSRPVFIIDGIFLYMESHFWTLTLFLVLSKDFARLGIAVVVFAVIFTALFCLIKNRIDQLALQQVYCVAVWLYAFSWLLRLTLDAESNGPGLWIALSLITFFTSFFRLAFNKRFFDLARSSGNIHYLLVKSYSSQFWLGICYFLLGVAWLTMPMSQIQTLQYLYLPAALLSMFYLRYSDLN